MKSLNFKIRKVAGAVKRSTRHLPKILVSFEQGTAGHTSRGELRRWCKPSVKGGQVTVRAFRGVWEVEASCFQFHAELGSDLPLRTSEGKAMRAQLSFRAGRHLGWTS